MTSESSRPHKTACLQGGDTRLFQMLNISRKYKDNGEILLLQLQLVTLEVTTVGRWEVGWTGSHVAESLRTSPAL